MCETPAGRRCARGRTHFLRQHFAVAADHRLALQSERQHDDARTQRGRGANACAGMTGALPAGRPTRNACRVRTCLRWQMPKIVDGRPPNLQLLSQRSGMMISLGPASVAMRALRFTSGHRCRTGPREIRQVGAMRRGMRCCGVHATVAFHQQGLHREQCAQQPAASANSSMRPSPGCGACEPASCGSSCVTKARKPCQRLDEGGRVVLHQAHRLDHAAMAITSLSA